MSTTVQVRWGLDSMVEGYGDGKGGQKGVLEFWVKGSGGSRGQKGVEINGWEAFEALENR